jgi:hypothetical protein
MGEFPFRIDLTTCFFIVFLLHSFLTRQTKVRVMERMVHMLSRIPDEPDRMTCVTMFFSSFFFSSSFFFFFFLSSSSVVVCCAFLTD